MSTPTVSNDDWRSATACVHALVSGQPDRVTDLISHMSHTEIKQLVITLAGMCGELMNHPNTAEPLSDRLAAELHRMGSNP